tara:strand:- start:3399 stop:4196 length:798 start_codon:yes stop_codon:yes gene_type:complete
MTTITTTGAGLGVEGGLCSAGVNSGLVACWDTGAGATYPGPPETATTWQDVIGGLMGTISCTDNFDTANGGSLIFDGVDDIVSVPNNDAFNPADDGDMTVCVWFKPATTSLTGVQRVVNTFGAGAWNSYAGWNMRIKKGTGWYVQGTGVADAAQSVKINNSGTEYAFDAWYLYSMVWDAGTKLTVYVDTTENANVTSGTDTIDDIGNALPLQLGGTTYSNGSATGGNPTNEFQGQIASVQIYNTALSSANITTNYNAAKTRFGKS